MYKRILALIIAFLLAVNIPMVAFAAETEGTTTATESSTETTGATETTAATEGNTEPAAQTYVTEPGGQTDPTQATGATESTQFTDPTDSTQGTETTDPTDATKPTGGTEPTQATGATESAQSTDPTDSTQGTETTDPTDATKPTGGTEPTQPTNPTDPAEPTGSQIPTSLQIDTENIYEGMDKAYEDGYVPAIENGYMTLVLPLVPIGEMYNNQIKVSLNLGSSSSAPFVIANYEKTFSLESKLPKNSNEEKELFLVAFDIKMSNERRDGVYPVTVNVSGYDMSGNAIDCIYTIYVTITDGKTDTPVQTYVEQQTAEPVVYISKSEILPENPMAGEEFRLTITLKNSLTTKSVKNMLVTVDTGNMQINNLEDSNVFQIDNIPAGGETTLTLRLRTDASLPAGKYTLGFSFKYDSSKTLNLSSAGNAIIEVKQPTNMELVMPRFAESVTVGETIPLSLQVMNMGRDPMYNVRCVVSGFGFAPSNTGYIGKMEAGSSSTTKIELYIIALNASTGNESGNQYGDTTGTITLIFEDESGVEYKQETTFSTAVNRPIIQIPQTDDTEEKEETVSQWWISVLTLGGVILAAGIGFIIYKRKSKKRGGAYL